MTISLTADKTGAGISTSAGIPDFRSPNTGLYANLARLNLPFAEAVFDISYFRNNPIPFYTLAQELYPGKYKPTITHSFIKLLHDQGRLLMCFTQNIDCLENEAGVPADKIVAAHGSFATQRCIECKTEYPDDLMLKHVMAKDVPHCLDEACNGLVKPDIVFFGEAMPERFHIQRAVPADADLAIVMGTSLSVQPFASLPSYVKDETPRLLINLEKVGGLGGRADDVLLLGDCDSGVRKLADALGWRDELEAVWQKTNPSTDDRKEQEVSPKTRDEKLEEEVEKLTQDIDTTLKVSGQHTTWLKEHLGSKHDLGTASEKDKMTSTWTQPGQVVGGEPNGEKEAVKADSGATNAAKDDGSGISHVYPHIGDNDVSEKPEKASL